MMGPIHKLSLLVMLLTLHSVPEALADTKNIAELSKSLMQAKTNEEKCRLHMFRARNYNNIGNIEKAEEDYDSALQYDHKGWIHLERAKFYLQCGDHEQAGKEAVAAQEETPTLSYQTQKILSHVNQIQKKAEIEENEPKVILLTKRWNVTKRKVSRQSSNRNIRAEYAARNKERAKRNSSKKRGKS